MKKIANLRGILGTIVFAAVLIFGLAGCGEPGGGGGGGGPELPSVLRNTYWKHTSGDSVQFGTNTVTVTPASGSSRTFTLKDSTTVSELNQTTLFFGDSQTSDFIVYRDATINTVSLNGVQKTGGWSKIIQYTITFNPDGGTVSQTSKQVNSGNLAGDLPVPTKSNYYFGGWYTAQNGGGTKFTSSTMVYSNITVYANWTTPEDLSKSIQLTEENWKAILTEIETEGKYVNLDLSGCTRSDVDTGGGLRSDGTFDPIYDFSAGKSYIVKLILPDAATHMGYNNRSFRSFTSLKNVSASAVTTIGQSAFEGCTSLTSVSFPQATTIGQSAFEGCTSLTSVSFPAATDIGGGAFNGCTSLASVSFPAATDIGGSAFSGCTSLTSVSFPAATSIDNNPFIRCSSLVTFNLTGTGSLSVIEGGKALVRNNTELIAYPSASGSITLNTITSIGNYAFTRCSSLTSVSFPAVTSIGYYAFDLGNLTSVSFPAATSIRTSAFNSCARLTSVSFPAVTNIEASAFYNCVRLTSVSFPAVTNIGASAFGGYTETVALTLTLGPVAPTVGSSIFSTQKTVTVKVPANADGYGTIPATYSGNDATVNWGNGFRGGGWDGTKLSSVGSINGNITLRVEYQEE